MFSLARAACLMLVASVYTSALTLPHSVLAQAPEETGQANGEDWSWDWDQLVVPAEPEGRRADSDPAEPAPLSDAPTAQAPKDVSQDTGVEDWGGDWGDLLETEQQTHEAGDDAPPPVATPEPPAVEQTPADTQASDAPAASTEDWGWDWGDAPAEGPADWGTPQSAGSEAVSGRKKRRTIPPSEARVGSTAEPDFDGKIRTGYRLFAEAPAFEVIPSKKDPDMHPCLDCHDWAESDHTPRELDEPHDNFKLKHGLHGKGEFWCFTCHHLEGDGGLRTLEGLKVPFDEAYIVCSQCHAQETRDWYFGAHGKRVDNWRGQRRLLNCTACHYQHKPALDPRKAMPGPKVRMGMKRPEHWVPESKDDHGTPRTPAWQRIVERHAGK